MCERVFGPEYKIVEIGFDKPFQVAKVQPWHRDFPSPPESYNEPGITSLAFNLTGVEVTQDKGPFEVALGTHWDDGRQWNHEMFPTRSFGRASSGEPYESCRRWAKFHAVRL